MKRIISIFLLLCCLMMLPGCFFENREAVGIDKVGHGSAPEISAGLIPKLDLIFYENDIYRSFNAFNKKYQSIESNAFCRYEYPFFFNEKEYIIVYYKYDIDTYEKAKLYTFHNLKPFDTLTNSEYTEYDLNYQTPYAIYNSYVFYAQDKDIESKDERNARTAIFFAYNDKKCTLVFFGSHLSGPFLKKDRQKIISDFPEYLKMFSKYYDFSK